MAKDGKIAKVRELLQQAPHSYKDLMTKAGITKATAFSLDYYLGKQGYGLVKGQNDAKEVTLHIVSVPEVKVKIAKVVEQPAQEVATPTEAFKVSGPSTGRISAKPRSGVARALAGTKAAKKAK